MSRNLVRITTLVLLLLIIAWDIYLAIDGTRYNTISSVLASAPQWLEHLVVFGMGLLVGHWWWPVERRNPTGKGAV